MSYTENDGQVTITISRADYEQLMITLALAAGSIGPTYSDFLGIFQLVNRLNEGNPHFVPYRTKDDHVRTH